ncbi:InlB B-repeat-containing protein [Bifidobacterium pseudocatenulatum]|uniref:InlB B-repeat-containing protein n=1 Tax=Bifidobacterium pseudocatenulatum TaxID=28026 RepID=UPI00240E7E55|nr:InlB B-repeat-containing protein [Bifidobacterium pseudocatenulatum]WFB80117.1 InlB B-repeat-containing protein [Bifidobacterium pseudocatenulatum]
MGFFTRLIAGLVAASTLGAGLAGTAGAVDTTGATGDAKGVVKLASDDTSGLSDHLVNGDFEYPGANVLSKNRYDEKDYNWWGVSRKDKMVYDPSHETQWVSLPSTFDSDKFAWDSTEVARVQNESSQWHTNEVELQRDSRTGNMYAELCAYQANTSIRQYIRTTPGTLYKVRLKHASLSRDYLDKMQVLIGPDGNEQPVSMTRVESQNGLDATGESTASTTVSTHASNEMEIKDGQGTPYSSRNHNGQWATYEGVYVATSDVTSFTFKSVDAKAYNLGNLLDDIVFDKAYKLSYDKNATDANGSVPSDETAGATKQAKASTTGTLRLASDDDVATYAASNLPEQIVNGGFDYPSVPSWTALGESGSNKYNKGKLFATINPGTGKYGSGCAMSTTGRAIPNWNRLNFAWNSTQGDTHYSGGMSCEAGNVELNYDSVHHNQFAELTADQQGTAIYQDVKVTPGTMMKWSLKHSSATSAYVDKMQVLIGEPYKETAQEATRITSENGNKVGEKMTTISTPTTSDRADNKKWDTYSGTYLVPDEVTTVRFTFKSIASAEWYSGNDLDDIKFSRSYQLSYDKNAQDATGSVPSSQYGKENTVQPAEAKTTGTVKTVADDDSSKSLTVNPGFDVPDYSKLNDGGLHWMYVSPAEGEAWSFYDYINPAQPRHQVAGLSQATFGWQELTGGDYKTTLFELHREKDGNVCADVHGSRTIGQTIDTQAGVAYTVSIRHSGRSKGNAGSVQVLVGPDKDHLRPLEMSRMNVSRTGAKYGDRIGKVGTVVTTHSDSVDSTEGDHPAWDHSDDWETYSGTYVATGGKTVFAYRGVDKNGNAVSGTDSGADSVIDDLSFKLAYPLAYDKNAADASGQVPSNTTQTASSKPTGKVSDLVQRTTTREDGSVTVKTIDTSTDVVSGCQVYYPAGQRITLATLAKDNDCWDSSMLTRPGHTQLGWSQDSQATQAQAEVTMVEGGMTVYAVWVGNPVLTYDTNKPNTWNGQMPSTPASVSVAYNTAAADGSGWQSGDTSKIRGYRFLGWYAGPQDDAGLYDWNTLLTGNVTVYAHWQRLQASVVYDRNAKDAKGSHMNTTGWQYSDVTVPSDTSKSFKRDGYVFLGWDTQADGNGTAYKDGSQVPLQDKDIVLFAQWQPVFEQFTPTGGVSLPLLVAGGVTLLVMGIGSTVMLTRRMRGEQ